MCRNLSILQNSNSGKAKMPPPLYSQEVRWTNMFGGANKPQHGRVWALKSQCAARTASVNILRIGISLLERQPPMHVILAHFVSKIANVWVPTPSLWPVLQPKHFVCVLLRNWNNSLKRADFAWIENLWLVGNREQTRRRGISDEIYRNYSASPHCIAVYTVLCEETEASESWQNNAYFSIFSELCCFS